MSGIEPRTVTVPPTAAARLRAADATLAAVIDAVGPLEYRVDGDLWRALVGSIVGQQLSVKAASTIRGRVEALGTVGFPTPAEVLEMPEERLRSAGLSGSKASYVRDAASKWLSGGVGAEEIAALDDDAVVERLVAIRGVGRWTAEMVLIFGLGRPDVLAVDDLGIVVAVQRAYGMAERPAREVVRQIGDAWRPHRSYASLYLWRSLAK